MGMATEVVCLLSGGWQGKATILWREQSEVNNMQCGAHASPVFADDRGVCICTCIRAVSIVIKMGRNALLTFHAVLFSCYDGDRHALGRQARPMLRQGLIRVPLMFSVFTYFYFYILTLYVQLCSMAPIAYEGVGDKETLTTALQHITTVSYTPNAS